MLPFNWGDNYPERVTLDDGQVQDKYPEKVKIDNGQDQTKAEAEALGMKYGLRVNETEVRLTYFKLTLNDQSYGTQQYQYAYTCSET